MYALESILSSRLSKQEPMCLGCVSDPRKCVGILDVYFKWVYSLENVKPVLRNLIVFQNPYSRRGQHRALHFLSMSRCGPGTGPHLWQDKRSQVGVTHLTKEKTAILSVNSSPRPPDNNFHVGSLAKFLVYRCWRGKLALARHFLQRFCFWKQGVEITLFSKLFYTETSFQAMTCPWRLSSHKEHWAPFWVLKHRQEFGSFLVT